jgi:hypothetical protein
MDRNLGGAWGDVLEKKYSGISQERVRCAIRRHYYIT